ncbi:MAG: ABC transporter ATP-binding protein [Acetobacteraceae bacterium]|nr:ABC transporter ATP-binding protein [Acetobacteraceae bacterium]MDW8397054.1 ABC transporter ATP-binding protein [Acetobacteraceae bacterium]
MTGGALELRGLSKRFGQTVAVAEASFSVPEGRLATLLGPSGCGKTTVLRMVAGLEAPSAGRILIGGRDVTALPAAERGVSLVFQSYALFPHMSVLENVAYGLTVAGVGRREARARAEEAMAGVGLQGLGARLPSELSGGQQQRVALARALVLRPRVLLFDEPLSNLDARLRRRVREDIRALQQRLGLTVLYVTHDQHEALAVSDTVIVMRQGAIAQIGTPRDLYERPADRFVADFIGEAALLPAEVLSVSAGIAALSVGPLRLSLPANGAAAGRAATLAVRPHGWRLGPEGLPARLLRSAYLGSHLEALFETALGEVFATLPLDAPLPPPGGEVRLAVDGTPGAAAVVPEPPPG